MPESTSNEPASDKPVDDRLNSWKEIAVYLKRDVTTVQRWEKRERMPVHRHLHDKIGSVYASRAELDAWARSRQLRATPEGEDRDASTASDASSLHPEISTSRSR